MEKALREAHISATNAMAKSIEDARAMQEAIAENRRQEALVLVRGAANRLFGLMTALKSKARRSLKEPAAA